MRTVVIMLVTSLSTFNAYAKGTCQNPGLQWTINAFYVDGTVAAIQGDGAAYVNGETGVDTVINVCSGTYDATLNLSGGRSLSFTFSQIVVPNPYTPSWALAGSTESGPGFVNIRDLWFVPSGYTRDGEYTFTTWMSSVVPAKGTPGFSMVNPSHDTPVSGARPDANYPDPNARVMVQHCPASTNTATCPNVSAETWFVYPEQVSTTAGDPAPVGTLHTTVKGVAGINSGEFRMPFSFTISLLN